MKGLFTKTLPFLTGLVFAPAIASAQAETVSSADTLLSLGGYISFAGFAVGTILLGIVIKRFGTSTLGSIFRYLLIGTAILVCISIFLTLGASFFGIADDSVDIWWHLLFYMAFIFYFYSLKLLVDLGNGDPNQKVGSWGAKMWGLIAAVGVALIFILPPSSESVVSLYTSSIWNALGLHHFIAFAFAGTVGVYLLRAKSRLGQIGRAIADPVIIAVGALSLQHLWELLNESWKVVQVSGEVGEGVEKVFLTVAALSLIWAAVRLLRSQRM